MFRRIWLLKVLNLFLFQLKGDCGKLTVDSVSSICQKILRLTRCAAEQLQLTFQWEFNLGTVLLRSSDYTVVQ